MKIAGSFKRRWLHRAWPGLTAPGNRALLRLEMLESRLLPSSTPHLLRQPAISVAREFTDVKGAAFFVADDGVHGTELWKSNGTAAGTLLVKDISPGSAPSGPHALTNVNGTLFFRAKGELWRSNGTPASTTLVK